MKKKSPNAFKFFSIVILVLVASFIGYRFLLSQLIKDSSSQGSFGDSFGLIAAFSSALAFFGVIYAIILQQAELKLQRQELKLARDQLENIRAENAKNNDLVTAKIETERLNRVT